MCGVAGILKGLGFEVYGSEKDKPYPPSSEILKKLNIPIFKPDPENIKKIKPDSVIVGNIAKKDRFRSFNCSGIRDSSLFFSFFFRKVYFFK
nr:hypothetical protein [Thermodesulfobacteriota bacterium]